MENLSINQRIKKRSWNTFTWTMFILWVYLWLFDHLMRKKNHFLPLKEDEEIVSPEIPYLSAIRALIYLANYTRPDIAFTVNLLARYSSTPIKKHWNRVKHILHYLCVTTKIGLFYSESNSQLIRYANAGYLSNLHIKRSQSGYILRYCNFLEICQTNINGYFIKSFRNYWNPCSKLRMYIAKVIYPTYKEKSGLLSIEDSPTILFEDNVTCIAQLRGGFNKGDKTKHVSQKFFYIHKL